MRNLLRRLTALAGSLAAAIIIGFALLTVGLRLALPHADGLRKVVAAALGTHLGAELEVGELGVYLHGLQPGLTLDDAVLRDRLNGETLLALDGLRVDLDLHASLLARAPRIDGVTLVGARIEVRRGADGRIGVRGLDQLGGGDGRAAAFFLREGHFSLDDSEVFWTDTHAGVPTLAFRVDRLDLINEGGRHQLRVDAAPPGDPAGELTLLADLAGPPGQPGVWSGRVYADWRGSNLARVLRGRLPAGYRLATDALHVSSWNRLDAGRLTRSVNRIWLDDLVLRHTPATADTATEPPARLDLGDVGALARWERDADGWRLDAPRLRIFGSLLGAEEMALRLRGGPTAGGRWVQTRLDTVPLQRLAEAARFAAPAELPQALRTLLDGRIAGRIEDLRLRLDLPGTDTNAAAAERAPPPMGPAWLAQGRISDLGIGPAPTADAAPPEGPVPPVDGLDLAFSATPDRGAVEIDADDVHLDLRPHLIEPLRLTRLAGLLQWRLPAPGGIELWTHALTGDTADVATQTRLALRTAPGESPHVDLHSHIRGGDASAVPRYLPVSKMDDRLEDWLTRAIIAGRLTSGDLLLRGPLADFPFDAGNGWFRLELRVRDGVLDYQPQRRPPAGAAGLSSADTDAGAARTGAWPWLEDIDATLRFDRRRLDIDVASARILSTGVTSGSASMPNLWQPGIMTIQAAGTGPLTDGLAFLADTPLAAKVGGIPRALDAEGAGELSLRLEVPLRRGLGFGFAGELGFGDDAAVTLRDAQLRLTDIAGSLRFDNRGLSANGIDARLGGQALRLDIATEPPDAAGDGGHTDITVGGTTAVADLAAALPSPWWGLADGRADWQLRARLSNADAVEAAPPMDLRLTSDLAGVALDLPAPFGKTARAQRPLSIETRLAPGAPVTVAARLGELGARLELARGEDGLTPERVAVDLNALPERLPDARGLSVQGRLGELDLGPWLAWQRTHAGLLRDAGAPASGASLPLLPVRLGADTLVLGALRWRDLDAALTPTPGGGWRIGVEAAGNSGTVSLPGRTGGAIAVGLDTLDIAPLMAGGDEKASDRGDSDPRELPPLSLQIEALRRADDALGRLRLDLARAPNGLQLTELSLTGPLVRASATGGWTRDATGYTRTSIDVDLRSDDLGELLRNAGYYSALAGAPSKAQLALTWPGGPDRFSFERARGSLAVDIGAGRMLDVEPGVGRMLGILNLGALERRLSLDFSDVVETGFAFDAIEGKVVIGTGLARISQLDILASTADIRLRGVTDLVGQTFDQTARVTPKIGTGVAIAGAVAGGPLVGAAVLLADKVSGNSVNQLASYEYRITGPWSAPEIQRIAGNGAMPSLPDLLVPEQATGRNAVQPPKGAAAAAQGRDNGSPRPAQSRPVSPFLDTD